jgi:ribose 5-phosphate isomerase A
VGAAGRRDLEKQSAAGQAVALVENGMTLGLGTGTTVAYLLPALAARGLEVRCVATSLSTETEARRLGLEVVPFEGIERLDLAIDGADQVAPDWWLVKGGGGAHTREKIVAGAAERFVVIVSEDKLVAQIEAPIPLEILRFGLDATVDALSQSGQVVIRAASPPSPDEGIIADWHGPIDRPEALAGFFDSVPGVVSHGLFAPDLVTDVVVGRVD